MCFYSEAKGYLEQRILPEVNQRLNRIDEYIHRTLLPAGEQDAFTTRSGLENISDTDLLDLESIVLIGKAGAGKTSIVLQSVRDAIHQFLESEGAPYPVFLDMALHLPRDGNFEGKIRERAGFELQRILEEHSPGLYLFIDAVDEALRQDYRHEDELGNALESLAERKGRLNLLMACRRGHWKKDKWEHCFDGKPQLYHVDEVQPETYAQIIEAEAELRDFRKQCKKSGFDRLLENPFDGFDLARRFRETGKLPDSRAGHLDRRIDERLTSTVAQSRPGEMRALPRLRELARLLATLGTFANETSWTLREAVNSLAASPLTSQVQPIQPQDVKTLFETRLFKASNVERNNDDEVRYAFDHELYRETLAAQQLTNCSLRKQRSLICIDLLGEQRIANRYRGAARMLAERSRGFREFLIETDPVVAVFCDPSILTPRERQDLARRVLDWCVRMRATPHSEYLKPSGQLVNESEALEDALSRIVPAEPKAILEPLLRGDEFESYWGTRMVQEWECGDLFKDRLECIVRKEEYFDETRAMALGVLHALNDSRALSLARDYLKANGDWLRAQAFRTYADHGYVDAQEVVRLLGNQLPHEPLYSIGAFRYHVERHVRRFSESELLEAFQNLPEPSSCSSGQKWLASLLLSRAGELDFTSIPDKAHVIGADRSIRWLQNRKNYIDLLSRHEEVWHTAVGSIVNQLKSDPDWMPYRKLLAKSGDSEDIHIVKEEASPLDQYQKGFLNRLLDSIKRHDSNNQKVEPSHEGSISERVEHSLNNLRQSADNPDGDIQYDSDAVREALDSDMTGLSEARSVLQAVLDASESHSATGTTPDSLNDLDSENLKSEIEALEEGLQVGVQEVLADEVSRILRDRSQQPTQASPAWMKSVLFFLCDKPSVLGVEACELLLRHSDVFGIPPAELPISTLTDFLKDEDPDRCRQVICDLVDTDDIPLILVLDDLREMEDWSYFQTALKWIAEGKSYDKRGKIRRYALECAVQRGDLQSLYQAGWTCICKTLYTSKTVSGHPSHAPLWFDTLVFLMNAGDDRAWKSFRHLLSIDILPLQSQKWHVNERYPIPHSEMHFEVLVDWALGALEESEPGNVDDYSQLCFNLAEHICDFSDVGAYPALLRFLQSLPPREVSTFRGWIHDAIQSIHHQEVSPRAPEALLETVLKEQFSIIRSEADLTEVGLTVLEDLQRDYNRGWGVAGFWREKWEPRKETYCQNILWSQLRPRLREHGLTHFEEEPYVGPNRSDLRIYCTQSGKDDVEIFLELKVARDEYERTNFTSEEIVDQLLNEHMLPAGCRHGIYTVLWLKDPEGERCSLPKTPKTKQELIERLEEACLEINDDYNVRVEPVVLDASADFRKS